MPATVATGSGPIGFTSQDGKYLEIPLSALTFDASGNIQASGWPLYTKYKAEVDGWLGYLVKNGAIAPGAAAPATQAIVIKAADPGGAGNNIQVIFGNVVPDPANAANTTFDATIVETDTYPLLSFDATNASSPTYIKNVLGTETIAGSQPGLVKVRDADTPTLPKAGSYQLAGGGGKPSTSKIDGDPSGTAFNFDAKKAGKDGDSTKVTIANVDAAAKTLGLTVVWTQSIAGIKVSDLPAKLAGSGYEIAVSAPASGFAVPAIGPVGLTGGADAQPAQTASATAVAS